MSFTAYGQAEKANSLDQLLEIVKRDKKKDNAINRERESKFKSAKDQQAKLLSDAKAELAREKARGDRLKNAYDTNEKRLSELETKLKMTMGTLGELFGVVRQVAGIPRCFETSSYGTVPGT